MMNWMGYNIATTDEVELVVPAIINIIIIMDYIYSEISSVGCGCR